MNTGLIVETPALNVFEQMAADEFFCERMPEKYILRFFNWKEPGITFGFSQRNLEVLSQIPKEDRALPRTRRPTGGGIVFHKKDLTFSFIFYNPGDFNPFAVYEKLHGAINAQFSRKGVNLEILSSKTGSYTVSNPAMDCFSKPVEKDLMSNGRKVLGGALRKFSDYMLYQASFQMEDARENSSFYSQIMKEALCEGYSLTWRSYSASEKDLENIRKIAYNKYYRKEWVERI
ncbi:MAG: hypothetical protein Fur0012_10080 [Elusimicrobiota bacterium]